MYHVTVWLQSVRTPKCIQVKVGKIIFAQTAEIYIARVILHPNGRYLCIVDVYNQTQNKTKKAH